MYATNGRHEMNLPPLESLHFERSQVSCQRCKRVFANFMIEEIDHLVKDFNRVARGMNLKPSNAN